MSALTEVSLVPMGSLVPWVAFFSVCVIPLTILASFFFFLNIFAVFPDTEQTAPPTGPLPRLQATEVSWVLMGSLVPLFTGGTDAEAEAPILWPPDVKS